MNCGHRANRSESGRQASIKNELEMSPTGGARAALGFGHRAGETVCVTRAQQSKNLSCSWDVGALLARPESAADSWRCPKGRGGRSPGQTRPGRWFRTFSRTVPSAAPELPSEAADGHISNNATWKSGSSFVFRLHAAFTPETREMHSHIQAHDSRGQSQCHIPWSHFVQSGTRKPIIELSRDIAASL
jgi:hypothetical protein